MGSYVNSGGDFYIRQDIDENMVFDIISDSEMFEYVGIAGGHHIEVNDSGKYYEDELVELYNALSDYLTSAEIYFEGDPGQYWAHKFNGREWIEYEGEITYTDRGKLAGTI
jgi:hypothetical protein